MKWPWNAPDTPQEPAEPLNETDKHRLQRLEAEIIDLTNDVEISLRTIQKINAKLRERAKRDSENETEPDIVGEERPQISAGTVTKDSMRAIARGRGLIR